MSSFASPIIVALNRRLHARSVVLQRKLEGGLSAIAKWWLLVISAACGLRILASPIARLEPLSLAPYAMLILAPLATFGLALRWFKDGERLPQPSFRLSAIGRWRDLSLAEAKAHPLFGTSGIMVSLLIGMLINLPVRAAEYLVIMPAIPRGAPEWVSALHLAMTLDVVVLSSLYVVAFTMALRRVPSFPRFLLLVWMVDLCAQLLIARSVGGDLPPNVAGALADLLHGNVQKVMISMGLWLPYLILSKRVNVTFRRRVPA